MELAGNLGHLVYSTLVHPGDTWDEMWASLNRYLPEVKSRVSPDKPFGVSIRISRNSADRLTADPQERARLKARQERRARGKAKPGVKGKTLDGRGNGLAKANGHRVLA